MNRPTLSCFPQMAYTFSEGNQENKEVAAPVAA